VTTHWLALSGNAPRTGFRKIVLNEGRIALRAPLGIALGIGMPMIILVIFGSLPAFHKSKSVLHGLTYFDVYMPILIALSLAGIALFSLTIALPTYRQQGILRRLSTTPAPPAWVLAAQLIINLCLAVAALVIIVVVGIAGFGAPVPKSIGGFILALVLSIIAPFAYGLWIAAVSSNGSVAGGIATLSFFPLVFFAGLWVPRAEMPGPLVDVSNFTPLGASVQAVQSAMLNGFPPLTPLLVLPGYFILFSALAVRFFKWE
jgi:ABC-2 type transport system permease protein